MDASSAITKEQFEKKTVEELSAYLKDNGMTPVSASILKVVKATLLYKYAYIHA